MKARIIEETKLYNFFNTLNKKYYVLYHSFFLIKIINIIQIISEIKI